MKKKTWKYQIWRILISLGTEMNCPPFQIHPNNLVYISINKSLNKNINLQFNKNSYQHIKNDLPRSDFFLYLLGKCCQSVELFVRTTSIEDKYENTKLGWPIFAILKFSKFWRLIFATIFQFLEKKLMGKWVRLRIFLPIYLDTTRT